MPKWWFGPRAWFLIVFSAAVIAAAFLAWFLGREGLDRADKWSSVVFGAVGSLGVAAGALFRLWRLGDAGADGREVALSRLADAQREQWTAEQAARRVRDPWPLNVRWLSTSRAQAVMASWSSVRGIPGGDAVDLDGAYDRITDLFDRDDVPRRLVVLGDPGAGKSMLVLHLTLELLRRREAHAPVPVLLNAAGWNPVQPLDDWVAAQIVSADRRMAHTVTTPDGGRRTLARELVARGSVLPVLDGLDEMNDQFQRAALIGVSAATAAGRELVVTSRTLPYEAAVRACGPIPAAAVIELQPVPAAEAAQHLSDSTGAADTRWAPVTDHLTTAGGTPLTEALSTPLMIWLARMVYRNPGTDPEELLTAGWATSRRGIEEHLLDHLIPAAYVTKPDGVERTRRWLGVLARHMRDHRTYDLAWWRINEISPVPGFQSISVAYAILAALVVNIFAVLTSGPRVFTEDGDPSAWTGWLFIGAWLGVFVAFGRLLFTDRHHPRRLTLRGLRTLFLVVGTPLCLIGAMIGAAIGDPAYGLALALSAGIVTALGSGASVASSSASPAASIRMDRTTALVSGGTIGLATAFLYLFAIDATGPLLPWAAGAATGLAAILLSAWGQFCLASMVLRGSLPLRLIGTLDEACNRGILRRAGSVYQFRHGLLRDRLSEQTEKHPTDPTSSPGMA